MAGLEVALRSGNADLLSGAIVEILSADPRTGIDIKATIDRIGNSADGREVIDRAVRLLRQRYAAQTEEEDVIKTLVTLSLLDPEAPEKSAFFTLFETELRKGTLFAEGLSPAMTRAALFFDPRGSRLPHWLGLAHPTRHGLLLRAAGERNMAVPAESLHHVLGAARTSIAQIQGSGELFDSNEDAAWESAGLALLMLNSADGVAPGGRTAADAVALAGAFLHLGDGRAALAQLRHAAPADAAAPVLARWLMVADKLASAHPDLRPAISELASRYLWPRATADRLAALLRLDGQDHVGAALRLLGATTAETLQTSLGAAKALKPSASAETILQALCESPAGRAPLVEDDFLKTENDRRLPNYRLTIWTSALDDMPEEETKAFVRAALTRDPEAVGTHCLTALVLAQRSAGTGPGAAEASFPGVGALPELARDAAANWLAKPMRRTARHVARDRCDRLDLEIRDTLHLQSSQQEILDYVTLCPVDERSIPDSYLLNSSAAPTVVAYALADAIWDGETVDLVEFRGPSFAFSSLIGRDYPIADLNYGTMILPMLTGRGDSKDGGVYAGEEGPLGIMPAASRALLAAGSDPQMAKWLIARTADYKTPGGSPQDAGVMAATMAVLNRAWRDADAAFERRAQLDRRFGFETDESRENAEYYRSSVRRQVADEATAALEQLCPSGSVGGNGGACIGEGGDDARELSAGLRAAGMNSAGIDSQLAREARGGIFRTFLLLLLAHVAAWAFLLAAYPRSPAIQASVFWNPWVRKYLGLGYVQLLLLVVPPFTRRLLDPFRDGLTADGRLDEFRPEVYFEDIRGRRQRTSGPVIDRLAALVPSVDTKIWLQARSGSGKTWFLRNLANRAGLPAIFLNATSCVEGINAALKARTAGWVAESDFLEQLIHSGRVVVIIDGLNEVAADIRSDIVLFANRFAGGRILIATQPVGTARPMRADRIDVLPLAREQIETFLAGRAAEVLGPKADAALFAKRVRQFVDSLDEGSEEERRALLEFVSNPMDLRLVADLLAAGETPDLLNLQEQQIRLVEADYRASNDADFPIAAFAEFLYALRRDNKPLVLAASDWPAERVALHDRRLVLRDDAPDGGERWRFRHDKITDYFLYRAFQTYPDRQAEHFADNRFIGVYVLMARKMPREQARTMLSEIYWVAGRTNDFTIGKAFQEALEQKLAIQKASPQRNLSRLVE